MCTYRPTSRTLLRFAYLNGLMLLLVLGSAAATLEKDGGHSASLASLLIFAATAGVIFYEGRNWQAYQVRQAVRTDLERLNLQRLFSGKTFPISEAVAEAARSRLFREDLRRGLVPVWASPLFVQGVALVAVRDLLWPYACAIGCLCFVYSLIHLPKPVPIEEGLIRSTFEEMHGWLRTATFRRQAGQQRPGNSK